MKKSNDLSYIFLIASLLFSTIFFGYSTYSKFSLDKEHEEVRAKITDVVYVDKRREHSCTVTFVYEENDKYYENSAKFNRSTLDKIKDVFSEKYIVGKDVIVYKNEKGDFQLENEIEKEVLYSLFWTIASFVFLIFIIKLFLEDGEEKQTGFYIQKNNYKIKNIKNVNDISEYIKMLKTGQIICFGFGNKSKTLEYSYSNGKFFQREIKGKSEKETEIENESVIYKEYKSN